ncbi:hypothetical protein ACN28S_45260 [Cystobacter fuscus]
MLADTIRRCVSNDSNARFQMASNRSRGVASDSSSAASARLTSSPHSSHVWRSAALSSASVDLKW